MQGHTGYWKQLAASVGRVLDFLRLTLSRQVLGLLGKVSSISMAIRARS